MKQFYLLVILTIASISSVQSLNYSAILPGQVVFFNSNNQSFQSVTPTYSPIKALRFDSSDVVADGIIHYNFNTYHDTGVFMGAPRCLYLNGPSWIGWKVYDRNDGMQIFFNFNNDSIFLNTSAQINDVWHFYKMPDSSYIEATVSNTSWMNFYGITDSVKIISLQAKDSAGNSIANIFNSKEIWLSKNNGLFLFYQVSDFPVDSTSIIRFPNFSLPTRAQYYNFNIGDEFQYGGYCQDPGNPPSPFADTYKYLDKYYSPGLDTVYFVVLHIHATYTFPQGVPTYSSATDTSYITNLNDPYFTTLPEENIIDSAYTIVNVYRAKVDSAMFYGRTQFNGVGGAIGVFPPDSCIGINEFDAPFREYTSAPGIGMTYSLDHPAGSLSGSCQESLFYYKKGNEVYGTPGVFTNLNSIVNFENKITVSPNPASNMLSVSSLFPLTTTIKIYDSEGRQLKNIALNKQSTLDIDLIDLNNGVYFLMLQSGQEIFKKKFIIVR